MSANTPGALAALLVGALLSGGAALAQEGPAAPPPVSASEAEGTPSPGQSASGDLGDLEALLLATELAPIRAASFREQSPREAPAAVLVITAAQIQASGARTLGEVLERYGGLGIVGGDHLTVRGVGQTNTLGGVGDAGRALLLIDGVRVNDVFSDSFALGAAWGVEDIERIEILKGPGSALYGTSAFAGVVNVVTRKGGDGAPGVTGRLRLEGLGRGALALRAGGMRGATAAALYGRVQSQGIAGELGREVAPEAAEVRGSVSRYGAQGVYGYHRVLTPGDGGAAGPGQVMDEGYAALGGQRAFGRVLSGTLQAQATGRSKGPAGEDPTLTELRLSGEGRLGIRFAPRAYLTTGAQVRSEAASFSGGLEGEDQALSRLVAAGYGELEVGPFAYTTVTAGVRAERYTPAEEGVAGARAQMVTPRLGIVTALPDSTTVKLLFGEAFQSPSLALLYSDTQGESITFLGNADLEAERLRSLELEVSRALGPKLFAQVNVFRMGIADLITPSLTSTQNTLAFLNLYDARVRGIEAALTLSLPGELSAYANLTLLDAYNTDTYRSLPLVPKVMANAALTAHPGERLTSFASLSVIGPRSGTQGDPISPYITLPATLRLDVSQSLDIGDRLTLALTVRNLFGAPRSDLEGAALIEGPGTEAYLELRLRPAPPAEAPVYTVEGGL